MSRVREILQKVPERCLESFLGGMMGEIRGLKGVTLLEAWFGGDSLESRITLRFLLTNKLVTLRRTPLYGIWSLVTFLSKQKQRSHLLDMAMACVGAFEEPEVSGNSDPIIHAQVVSALTLALSHIKEIELQSHSGLMHGLISGVQAHMGSSLDSSRQLGMRVAYAMSLILSPGEPVDFGSAMDHVNIAWCELDEDEDEEDEREGMTDSGGEKVKGSMRRAL